MYQPDQASGLRSPDLFFAGGKDSYGREGSLDGIRITRESSAWRLPWWTLSLVACCLWAC